MTRLDDIKARLKAATPGPWIFDSYSSVLNLSEVLFQHKQIVSGDTTTERGRADCEFVANAPTDIKDLVEALEETIEELELHCQEKCGEPWVCGPCETLASIRKKLEGGEK